jgi:hypothetical protein
LFPFVRLGNGTAKGKARCFQCKNGVAQSFDRQWHLWSVNQPPRCLPMVQDSSIVGISSIYPWTASSEGSSLMLIMAMASHGRRVSLLSCCLRGGGDSQPL